MEAAIGLLAPAPPPLVKLSEALSLENIVNASGKLGGVAGVFAGVHICGGVGKEGGEGERPSQVGRFGQMQY